MNYVKLATFIPWIIYFIEIMLYRIGVIETQGMDKKKYFKYINKNFFSSINVKEVFLFSIFVIFIQYENTTVLEMLFPAMYLYLTIDFFHSLAQDCKKIEHKSLMVISVVLVVALVAFFIFKDHLYTTYILMFAVSILSSFLVYLFSLPLAITRKSKKI